VYGGGEQEKKIGGGGEWSNSAGQHFSFLNRRVTLRTQRFFKVQLWIA
jgi:hypothetical protein